MILKFSALIFLLFLAGSSPVFSQEVEENPYSAETHLKKNSVFGNLGIMVPLVAGSASISYDRSIFNTQDDTDIRGKISIGYLSVFGGPYNFQSLTIGLLTGKRNNHFELFAGAALNQHSPSSSPGDTFQEKSSIGIFPAGNIGYRFQKPGGWFIFRTGIGFPDLGYLGFGVAF